MELAYVIYYAGIAMSLYAFYMLYRLAKDYNHQRIYIQKSEKEKWEKQLAFMDASIYEKLEQLQLNDMLVFWDANYQVMGKIKLIEMTWDEHDQRIPTGRFFPIIQLDNQKLLVSMPKGEGLDIHWFMLEQKERKTALTSFFVGSDDQVGPARRFADSDQQEHVEFSLPQDEDLGTWVMRDVGSFSYTTQGGTFVKNTGEMRHVLAQHATEPTRYMLYFDVEEGFGSDTLLVGQTIVPDQEIQFVLREES